MTQSAYADLDHWVYDCRGTFPHSMGRGKFSSGGWQEGKWISQDVWGYASFPLNGEFLEATLQADAAILNAAPWLK